MGERVVVVGLGVVTPFGPGIDRLVCALLAGESAVRRAPELGEVAGLRTRVAATVPELDAKSIPRKFRRAMSRTGVLAHLAAAEAVQAARLDEARLTAPSTGLCLGSTLGSPGAAHAFYEDYLTDRSIERTRSTAFFQTMSHAATAATAQALGVTGRVLALSAACATGLVCIGQAFETIQAGKAEIMLAGGADEWTPLVSATFDVIDAASTAYNDSPERASRPFDADRDGVVASEGAGVLVLEALDSARKRGAPILAELFGFAQTSDPLGLAHPSASEIARTVRAALLDARIGAEQIDYVNAHATGTKAGDAAEAAALAQVFPAETPVSSFKGHIGHSMAASGAVELAATIALLRQNRLVPTRNLEMLDKACHGLTHPDRVLEKPLSIVLKNNFALGGLNASLVLGRPRL